LFNRQDVYGGLASIRAFTRFGGIRLRAYQQAAVEAVLGSVFTGRGDSLVVMFPRQSGKNELQAQLEAYLLAVYANQPAEIIKVSPTWRPQSQNAMRRLERVLQRNLLTRLQWQRESGYIYRVGAARIYFLSAAPEAHIVGATASLLLEVDEAQDVSVEKFDREIAPMAASTHATRVFWGTAWTPATLLGRELRASHAEERADGRRRVFRVNAEEVAREVPAYRRHVEQMIARLGRGHPSIRTQYFSEEIEAEGGMFPPERLALMEGDHLWQESPQPGQMIAFLVDVGGETRAPEGGGAPEKEHDATALVIVSVDLSAMADPALRAPRYRVVHLRQWHGESHARLYAQIAALAQSWNARRVVLDVTGMGEGLSSFLEKALPGRVVRFLFQAQSKSRLGLGFIEVVESGRFRLPRPLEPHAEALVELFRAQCRACRMQPGERMTQAMRWGVPEGARHPQSGGLLHDDLLLAAALCAHLDRLEWPTGSGAGIIQGRDPLEEKLSF